MNFIAIDFEVANMWNRASACSIGIAKYENGNLVDEYYSLINPMDDFDPYCIDIHGITPEMIINEPTFEELWSNIQKYFDGHSIVAHNASFDMSVLRHCLNAFNLDYPNTTYFCTYLLSKKIHTGLPSYKLDYIVDHLQLNTFEHHQALDDAKAAANVMLNILSTTKMHDLVELSTANDYLVGKLNPVENTYRPFSKKRNKVNSSSYFKLSDITATVNEFDEKHPIFEKVFAFTGTLKSMDRKSAVQSVVDLGGSCTSGVAKKTNYLVVGEQDYSRLRDGKKSSKMKKAEEYANQGLEIEIITEEDFLKLL